MPSGKSFWVRPAPARSGGCDVAITADTLRHAAARTKQAAALAQDDLNAADGKIGDGDTGVMLRRLFEAVAAALKAASETLDAFRDRPNKLGRARMFGERTIGLDDPGMLAFSRLLIAVAA